MNEPVDGKVALIESSQSTPFTTVTFLNVAAASLGAFLGLVYVYAPRDEETFEEIRSKIENFFGDFL